MASYQLPGNMADKVLFLCPKKGMPGYEYGAYAEFMQDSVNLKLLCRDLSITAEDAIAAINARYGSGNEKTVAEVKAAPAKPKAKRFIKPSEDDIAVYMQEKGLDSQTAKNEAEKFFDYYESNGWKAGKNPMKDWKATARRWTRNNYSQPVQAKPNKLATPDRSALFDEVGVNQQAPLYNPLFIEGEQHE